MGDSMDNMLFSGTFFAVFFAVVAILVVAGIVTTIVMLIRGKGRRYVMMRIDEDGTMHPVTTASADRVGEPGMRAGNAAMQAHNEAHQQALNHQNITQQGLNNP